MTIDFKTALRNATQASLTTAEQVASVTDACNDVNRLECLRGFAKAALKLPAPPDGQLIDWDWDGVPLATILPEMLQLLRLITQAGG